jgi:hypothetical protein
MKNQRSDSTRRRSRDMHPMYNPRRERGDSEFAFHPRAAEERKNRAPLRYPLVMPLLG